MYLFLKINEKVQPTLVVIGLIFFLLEPFLRPADAFFPQIHIYSWWIIARSFEGYMVGTCLGAYQIDRRKQKAWKKTVEAFAKKHPTDTGIFD